MSVEELLSEYEISYEILKKENGIKIYRIGKNKIPLFVMLYKGNIFKMKRSDFLAIDTPSVGYMLLLIDQDKNDNYFVHFKNNHNWLSGSFENCDKDELYLGKQVLNWKMKLSDAIKTIITVK